ncbi:MAG: flagellar biosynthesis protein FliQ [Proteobacteria bacterium]|jgi:flagellar biosynthetic protein FliQ|nr:flagellar biosynthesis protein FliQ [Pseudomonadota bacterium]
MSQSEVAMLLESGLLLALKLAGPLLGVSLVVGLVISLIQAITQINEATLSFVPKVAAMAATLVLLGPFMLGALEAYARLLFDRIVAIGGS